MEPVPTSRRLRRRRRHLACALDSVLRDVLSPAYAFTAQAPVVREQVLEAQHELEQLVAHLRDDGRAVDADALLVVENVLCDTDGPLFVPSAAGALQAHLRLARVALEY